MVDGLRGGLYMPAYHVIVQEHDFAGPGGDTYRTCWGAAKALGLGTYPEHCVDGAYARIVCVCLEEDFLSLVAVLLFVEACFCGMYGILK